jgi:hypothetical protein
MATPFIFLLRHRSDRGLLLGRDDEQGRWFNKPVEVKKARNLLGISNGPAGEAISALF